MEINVASKLFYDNLNKIYGIVSTNNIFSLLENFLFTIQGDMLTATASDLENTMTVEIPITGKGEFSIAIPASTIMDIFKYLPEQPVSLKMDEKTYNVTMTTSNGTYSFLGTKPDDFPKIPEMKDSQTATFPNHVIKEVIHNTVFALSNDEARKAMMGLLCEFTSEGVNFVSTDAQKLVKFSRTDITTKKPISIILPKKVLNQLKTSVSDAAGDVEMEFNSNYCSFKFDNLYLNTRLIDAQYPDYSAVITTTNPFSLMVDRQNLISTLRRLYPLTSKTTFQAIFKLSGSQLIVSCNDFDYESQGSEELTVNFQGDDFLIAFNSKYLMELLQTLESQEVIMEMSTPQRACLVFPADKIEHQSLLMLIMPIAAQV